MSLVLLSSLCRQDLFVCGRDRQEEELPHPLCRTTKRVVINQLCHLPMRCLTDHLQTLMNSLTPTHPHSLLPPHLHTVTPQHLLIVRHNLPPPHPHNLPPPHPHNLPPPHPHNLPPPHPHSLPPLQTPQMQMHKVQQLAKKTLRRTGLTTGSCSSLTSSILCLV